MRRATPKRPKSAATTQGGLFTEHAPRTRYEPPTYPCHVAGCCRPGRFGYGAPNYFNPMRWWCVVHNPTPAQLAEMFK